MLFEGHFNKKNCKIPSLYQFVSAATSRNFVTAELEEDAGLLDSSLFCELFVLELKVEYDLELEKHFQKNSDILLLTIVQKNVISLLYEIRKQAEHNVLTVRSTIVYKSVCVFSKSEKIVTTELEEDLEAYSVSCLLREKI